MYRSNGVDRTTSYASGAMSTMGVNAKSSEQSDYAISDFILYNRELSEAEMT